MRDAYYGRENTMLDSWKSAGLDYGMRSAHHPMNEGLCHARHQNHTTVSIRC